MIDAALIQAVFSGLVLLLGAVGGLVTVRGRRTAVRARDLKALQRQCLAALAHIFRLERELAAHGIRPPPRPDELEPEDDDAPAPLPPPPQVDGNESAAGRHGR